ncbi:MAG TPA: hypothetical protein VMK42_04450 [Anaeromyxobacteraceae bacterium]|nr:hypothetical protein [Anaeromyxobacteraceae bacterium]
MDRKNEKKSLCAISEDELATVSGGATVCELLAHLKAVLPGGESIVGPIINSVGCGCNTGVHNGQHG